ncbi:TPA: hypothetical protein HA273_05760 [Candidatus Bathyarchaeota archaeon]|nr:hypothetical protein [Candidatus Bathyarchaeota archaeon]HIJ07874.1 hypothetical protein [Candidatus Bathyarchaeota archaeon]
MQLRVREIDRDESLGILRKSLSIDGFCSFESPSKGIKFIRPDSFLETNSRVNEIVKKIDEDVLDSLEEGASSRIAREIGGSYRKGSLNLVLFNLTVDRVPSENKISTLAHHLYASSQATISMPTVRSSLFKEGSKITEKRVQQYIAMMRLIIEEIRTVGNSKILIGTVPLLAPKYSRSIVNFYHEYGINAFCVDGNTSDLLTHEADFRSILSSINSRTPLSETLILANNLGYPQFEQEETRADDFLSIFAYIDVLGGTFKIRGVPVGKPRLKQFSRRRYSYKILPPNTCVPNELKNTNQREQLEEAHAVQKIVGEERMEKYIEQKSKVDEIAISRLKSIAGKIKVD